MHPRLGALALAALLLPEPAAADAVVPSEQVRSRVIVRADPEAAGAELGSLRPGERAEYLGAAAGWRRVRLGDGAVGFVSASWTRVEKEPVGESGGGPPAERRSASVWQRLGSALGLGGPSAPVEFAIRDPELGDGPTRYRNSEAALPVSGFATLAGASANHDIVLVIDVSGSTNEFAGADVDGDGRIDDRWKGGDSIHRAELAAAQRLVSTLERMPHNEGGRRIRVGIVSYSGDPRWDGAEQDASGEFTRERLTALAERDAEPSLPLTGDYEAARRSLAGLAQLSPAGMTDIAAGVVRGLALLEEAGPRESPGEARRHAQQSILLLTDGKPSLPHDRATARRAVAAAGALARERGVRVNAFAIGEKAARLSPGDPVRRMARQSGGRYRAMADPAEIVSALETTGFSVVERVKLVNATTGRETRQIATGIDGSFYGEIELAEGDNRIRVAALLSDGREAWDEFDVEFVRGAPTEELTARLERIRAENEALIERIRSGLARELEAARQRKQVEVFPANQR